MSYQERSVSEYQTINGLPKIEWIVYFLDYSDVRVKLQPEMFSCFEGKEYELTNRKFMDIIEQEINSGNYSNTDGHQFTVDYFRWSDDGHVHTIVRKTDDIIDQPLDLKIFDPDCNIQYMGFIVGCHRN